ncbi:MAG: hypothetical protein K2N38_13135 [Oscillospiraceae bacterium]|nr:hypothetical protein [Oscillospiraceae bacterium]
MSIMDIDFGGDLEAMNESFRKNRDKIKLPPPPPWLGESDELSKLYSELPLLLKRGDVYYACVVQANRVLFNKPTSRSAMASVAEIVFNHKRPKTTVSDPLIMKSFAHYLYECKERKPEDNPEWIREAASVIAGEVDRSRVIIKTNDDDFAMDITMQSVIVFREHLPKKVLKSAIVPIIAAPAKCFSVMILPCRYWSKGFVKYWDKL